MAQNKAVPNTPFYLGGVSAAMASCCTHPIDQQKYRLQVQKGKVGMLQSLARTTQQSGLAGLWEGASASILRQMTYSITRFALYDAMKSSWKVAMSRDGALTPWELAVCAGAAGGIAGLVGNPAEASHKLTIPKQQIVLVRMCTDAVKPSASQYRYNNCFQGIYRIIYSEGIGALYRGTGPNVLRSISMNVSQLAAYDVIKSALLRTSHFSDTISTHLFTGFLAGTIATTVAAPFDVLKSRVQSSQGQGLGVLGVLKEGMRLEGPRFLMKGWTPAWLRLTLDVPLLRAAEEAMVVNIINLTTYHTLSA